MSFHFLLKTLFLSSAAAVLLAGCGNFGVRAGSEAQAPQAAAADAPFPVDLDGVYGYVDQKGEWVIPPRFEAAHLFQDDGAAWVRHASRDDGGLAAQRSARPSGQDEGIFGGVIKSGGIWDRAGSIVMWNGNCF